MDRRMRVLSLIAAASVAMSPLTSCSDDPTPSATLQITGAWARTSAAMADVGAAYFQITSPVDDRLVAVRVDPSVAAAVEIHETTASDDHGDPGDHGDHGAHGSHGAHGAMTMKELPDGLPLSAGDTVTLEPGGYHLMLMGLAEPLMAGDRVELVLILETAGEVPVTVDVRDQAP